MKEWAEVHRSFHREGVAKAWIVRMLGMSRNTVDLLLVFVVEVRPGFARREASGREEHRPGVIGQVD